MAEPFRLEDLSPEARAGYMRMMYGGRVRESLPQPQPQAPAQPAMQPTAAPAQPDIPKIKRNVRKMLEQDAPDEDVEGYLQAVGVTPDQLRAHKTDLSWSEVPGKALDNLNSSAGNFAQAMVYPLLHPIDTAKAIGNMAYGAGSKIGGALGVEQDPQRKAANEAHLDAVGQFFSDRYGSMEDFKRTLAEDPVGVAADLSVILTGGGAAGARAPGIVGRAAQTVSNVGKAIDPMANVARAAKGTGKLAAAVTGMTSGTSAATGEAAFQAGRVGGQSGVTYRDNMRGQAPITDVLDMAKSAMEKWRAERRAAYESGMGAIRKDTTPISFEPVVKTLHDARAKLHHRGIIKSQDAAKVYDDILAVAKQFEATPGANTVDGLDALKQAIGEIRQKTQFGTLERSISNDAYNAVKAQIVKQAPNYAKAMKEYSQASEMLEELTKTFSLGEKSSKDAAIRRLTSAMRNNVNTNFGRREQLLKVLAEKEPNLPAAIAGLAHSSVTPRGLGQLSAVGSGIASLSNPLALPALAAASPRLVGETAHALGRASGSVESVAKALGVDPELVARVMRGSYAVNQASQPALVGSQTGNYPAP